MRRVFLPVLLVLICWLPEAARAFEYADCSGRACRWSDYPISYALAEPLGVTLDDATAMAEIRASIERWGADHQTLCEPLSFEYSGRAAAGELGQSDGRNVVSFVTDGWLYGDEALAVTLLWHDDKGVVQEADIAFNAVDYQWSTGPEVENDGIYALRPTLTHEAGHFWGLGHSTERRATMYPYYLLRNVAEDLDEDDIRGAAERFCDEPLPPDDSFEQNDVFNFPTSLDEVTGSDDLRLYDDDWFVLQLAAERRVKVTMRDESTARYKVLELYNDRGERVDAQDCYGDCAQALGKAGKERWVKLRVAGDFDNHRLETALYRLTVEQVIPGQEGELTDDDDGGTGAVDADDDDSDEGCGCGVAPTLPPPTDLRKTALYLIMTLLFPALLLGRRVEWLRRKAQARESKNRL